jgi:inhibitor of cysteine peptidase
VKAKNSILIFLILIAGILTACKPAASSLVNIGEQDAGKTIELKTGDTLVVSLEGNVTTGFNWVPVLQDPELLKQVGEAEVTPASNQLGAPGKIVLKFEAAAVGQTILHLDYKRPWEVDIPPEKVFEVTVVVR